MSTELSDLREEIRAMRQEIGQVHIEVMRVGTEFKHVSDDVHTQGLVIFGPPDAEPDQVRGLVGRVEKLERWHAAIVWAWRGLWTLGSGAVGFVAAWLGR